MKGVCWKREICDGKLEIDGGKIVHHWRQMLDLRAAHQHVASPSRHKQDSSAGSGRGGVAWHMSVPGVAWRWMRLASRRGLPLADSQGRGWSLKETDGGGGAGGQAAGGAGGCGLGEGAADGPQVGGGGEPGGLLLHALTCMRL